MANNYSMQGGVKNYLGQQEEVIAPKFWQSSKDSPPTELAYITDAEKGLLVDANLHGSLLNNKANIGASGLLSFDGWGDAGDTSDRSHGGGERYDGGDTSAGGGTSGGGSNVDVSSHRDTGTGDYKPSTDTPGDAEQYRQYKQGSLDYQIADYNKEQQDKNIVQKAIDLYLEYGIIPNAVRLGAEGLAKLGEFSSELQAKAMTSWFDDRLKKIYDENQDLEDYESIDEIPGKIGDKVREYESRLEGIKKGTYTQTNFTTDYGVKTTDDDGDRQYQNLITPYASYAVAGQTPVDSMVNKYFSNLNNSNLGISSDYLSTYNTAKANIANTLNMTPNTQQYGYGNTFNDNYARSMTSANPFFDELTSEGLI